jgi:hypothetical protein
MVPSSAIADEFPLSVSRDAIDSDPEIEVAHLSGGDRWIATWERDRAGRSLFLVVLKANGDSAPQPISVYELHDRVFKEGLTTDKNNADVRIDDSGEGDFWRGTVHWVLGSELAKIDPGLSLSDGKSSRGPDRRYCVSFVWTHGELETAGVYCNILSPDRSASGEEMLKSLDLQFR